MFFRMVMLAILLGPLLPPLPAADVLHLSDDARIAGQILAEKPDHLVIDVGYTVLMVPRDHVSEIQRAGDGEKVDEAGTTLMASPLSDAMYHTSVTTRRDRPVRELVQQLGEAVVQVRTPGGLGSGFILNKEGFLITNFHVIEGETQISVEVYHQSSGQLERKTYKQVRILAMNKYADLALLKIEDDEAPPFAHVSLGNSDELSVGDRVFAIGSPLGLERTVTEGIVSTKTRPMEGELYLQTTAQINPGNSGGPLFNLRGEVVGVTNMKIMFGEGLGFAIPVGSVKFFLNHRDAYAYDNDNPSNAYRYLEPPSRAARQDPPQPEVETEDGRDAAH